MSTKYIVPPPHPIHVPPTSSLTPSPPFSNLSSLYFLDLPHILIFHNSIIILVGKVDPDTIYTFRYLYPIHTMLFIHSFIHPLHYPSFPLSILSFIHPLLYPSSPLSILSFIHPLLYPSSPLSIIFFIHSLLYLSYSLSILSFIHPILYPSYPISILSFIYHILNYISSSWQRRGMLHI